MTSPTSGVFLTVDDVWLGGWRGPSLVRVNGESLEWIDAASAPRAQPAGHIPGHIAPGFTDSHVHLGLIDPAGLVAGGIASVVDLGSDPIEAVARRDQGERDPDAVNVVFAGAMLTAPGGYPSDRSWAAPASVRQVATSAESLSAIHEMRDAGAQRIKIALNADAGPVWDDELLTAVVAQSHASGLSVVAHTEGALQTLRAVVAGVDVLAHTPFTERLTDPEITRIARSVDITSTLDIHGYGERGAEFDIAIDNLTRFQREGGRVLYGTDLGNGPLPVGINRRELLALQLAGLDADRLVTALVGADASATFIHRISWLPGIAPTDSAGVVDWLCTASVLSISALEEIFA